MEFKGTKGEWVLEQGCNVAGRSYIHLGGNSGAIDVWDLPSSTITPEQRSCNAKLVAAAPDLLEALQELKILMDDVVTGQYTPDSFTTQPAFEAIRKALGE